MDMTLAMWIVIPLSISISFVGSIIALKWAMRELKMSDHERSMRAMRKELATRREAMATRKREAAKLKREESQINAMYAALTRMDELELAEIEAM